MCCVCRTLVFCGCFRLRVGYRGEAVGWMIWRRSRVGVGGVPGACPRGWSVVLLCPAMGCVAHEQGSPRDTSVFLCLPSTA